MDSLNIKIQNVRSIKQLYIELPIQKGLYAITGKNGSGKSTLMATIANLFYPDILDSFFIGSASNDSSIVYEYKDILQAFTYDNKKWQWQGRQIYMHGFYEGSLIHGNRFRDTHYRALVNASKVKKDELIEANPNVKENLGLILHDDRYRYSSLLKLSSDKAKEIFRFRGSPYFLEDNGKLISQLSLSTGENLLLSLLHSIFNQIQRRGIHDHEYFVLLDEVELALHPAALIRLVKFLNHLSNHYNMAIYFSTHSTDLIRNITPGSML